MNLDDYLKRLRAGLHRLPAAERDAVVEEVRAHLQDEAADLQANDPSLAPDDAFVAAVDHFGTPEEVAAGYDEQTGEVRTPRSGGEVALRVTKAVGRGAGKAALGFGKVLGIALLVVLGGAFVVAVAALFLAGDVLDTFQDDIRESVPRPLYGYHQSWGDAAAVQDGNRTESFTLEPDHRAFDVSLELEPTQGCVSLRLLAPDGAVRFDSGDVCEGELLHRNFHHAQEGAWTLEYGFTGFRGDVDVDAYYYAEA